eukprot:gene8446-biopygen16628
MPKGIPQVPPPRSLWGWGGPTGDQKAQHQTQKRRKMPCRIWQDRSQILQRCQIFAVPLGISSRSAIASRQDFCMSLRTEHFASGAARARTAKEGFQAPYGENEVFGGNTKKKHGVPRSAFGSRFRGKLHNLGGVGKTGVRSCQIRLVASPVFSVRRGDL